MGPIVRKKLFAFNALEVPIYRATRLVPRRVKGLLSLINRIWTRSKSSAREINQPAVNQLSDAAPGLLAHGSNNRTVGFQGG
jgi:hypothetical protein